MVRHRPTRIAVETGNASGAGTLKTSLKQPSPGSSPKQSVRPPVVASHSSNNSHPTFNDHDERESRGLSSSRGSTSGPQPLPFAPSVQHQSPNAPLPGGQGDKPARHGNLPTFASTDSPPARREPTQGQMVNRPVRESAHSRPARFPSRNRPDSRSSNVSKQRSRCASLASSTIGRQRRANISHEFTNGMAGVINQFTQQQSAALEEQKMKYHKYIRRVKRDLASQSTVIAQHISRIQSQQTQIEDLKTSKTQMTAKMEDIEGKLELSEERAQRLEEKYRICKSHLNSAIQEQQDLYTRSKKQWGDVIEELDDLTHRVEEKELELAKEKESVRFLTEKLQSLQTTSSGFEALAVQGKEIMNKLAAQQVETESQRQKLAEDFQQRLDQIATRLETLSNSMTTQPGLLRDIQKAQDLATASVTTKLEDILESRNAAMETTNQLSADLEFHTGKIWQRLDSQLEALSTKLAEKAEENGMVSTLYKRKDAECQEHLHELAMLRETTEKQTDQLHELEAGLVASDAAQEQSDQLIRRLEARVTETEQLRAEAKIKAETVAELQRKLDNSEVAHISEIQKCNSNIEKLVQEIKEKDQSSVVAAQRAAETARHEARAEMNKFSMRSEKTLMEITEHRDLLASELDVLKKDIQETKSASCRDAETIRLLQDKLATEETKGKETTEQFTKHASQMRASENQLSCRVAELEGQLGTAHKRASELESNNERQCEKIKTLVSGLRCWANQDALRNELDGLLYGDKSVDEIGVLLRRVLGTPLHSQVSPFATSEVRQDMVLLDGENLKFIPSKSDRSPSLDAGGHTDNDLQAKDDTDGEVENAMETGSNGAEKTVVSDPLSYVSSFHHTRRVVVQSPANVPNQPAAPSVDQEKLRRREAMQPKSIMKHETRSTGDIPEPGEVPAVAGHGAFRRSRHLGLRTHTRTDDSQANNEVFVAPDASITEKTTEPSSRRPSKRRRSESAIIDNASSSSQGQKRNLIKVDAAPKRVTMDSKKSQVSAVGTQTSFKGVDSTPNSAQEFQTPTTRNSRRYSGNTTQSLPRTPSANSSQVLGARQTNVRTYGSQRGAAEPPSGQNVASRFSLRSQSHFQPQSQYWPPKEKQGSQELAQIS
ncbi:uncharacterized protein C8A04DRAFT_9019 [Dichotomopilus funicola]|uniref:Uncharacterized protein n=1 Tax=Dichotomopilus funicola TaxID=1934379 RepID=A0AAN6V9W0_9PEZI|nr:hypothetical protein C8A04DRAFT_9019 [Dichotomopilus funicola]